MCDHLVGRPSLSKLRTLFYMKQENVRKFLKSLYSAHGAKAKDSV